MKIAILDDSHEDRQRLMRYVKDYRDEKHLLFDIVDYDDGNKLLGDIQSLDIEIIILDIYMPISGILIAQEIRKLRYDCAIIFVTISTEFYPESYEIGSSHYLIKPVKKEDVFIALDRCKQYLAHAQRYIEIFPQHKIYLHDIQYLEVIHNTTILHAHNDYKLHYPLTKVIEMMNDDHIVRIHKSFAVHFHYVRRLKGNQVELLNGLILNIGRTYLKTFKQRYYQYLSIKDD